MYRSNRNWKAGLIAAMVAGIGVLLSLSVTQAAEPEKSSAKIALGAAVLTPGYPYLYVAQSQGYWDQDGVKVDVLLAQGGAQVLQLLVSGQADVGIVAPETIVLARKEQNLPIKSIASISTIGSFSIRVAAASPINSVSGLKGKNIGVVSLASGIFPYLKARLRENGIDPDKDVTILPVGFGATASTALTTGKVDALVLWRSAFAAIENSGVPLKALPASPWEANQYSLVAVATEERIKSMPETLRRVLRGMAKASDFTAARPAAAAQIFWNAYPNTINKSVDRATAFKNDLSLINAQLTDMGVSLSSSPKPPNRLWGDQTVAAWSNLEDYLVKSGQLKEKMDPGSLFVNDFTKGANDYDHAAIVRAASEFKVEFDPK